MRTRSKPSFPTHSNSFKPISESSDHISITNNKYAFLALRQIITFVELNIILHSNPDPFFQFHARARAYLKAISELSNAKLFIASVGPGREQTIFV